MASVVLHHGTGAQDFSLVGEALPRDQSDRLFKEVGRLLGYRHQQEALDLLVRFPFEIYSGTNHFGDDFHVLFARVSLPDYEYFRTDGVLHRDAARIICESLSEVEGPSIRFAAVGLKLMEREEAEATSAGSDLWDIFISYASEDRESVAKPLASTLSAFGLRVWFDRTELKVGDSLREKIDLGLARSRFGAVILSEHFFAKHYPVRELNGLAQREIDGSNILLPIWSGVSDSDVRQFSPPLADKVALNVAEGIPAIAWKLLEVVWPEAIRELRDEAGKYIKRLPEIPTGKVLADVIDGSHAYNFANDELEHQSDADVVAAFFQHLEDWGDVSGMLDAGDKVRGEFMLAEAFNELKAAGWKVFGVKKPQSIQAGGAKHEWLVATVVVAKSNVTEVVEAGQGGFGLFRRDNSSSNAQPTPPADG